MNIISTNSLVVLSLLLSLVFSRREQKIFKISFFYDDSSQNIEDLISNSIDAVNRIYRQSRFQLDFNYHKVDKTKAYQLIRTFCDEIEDGRIAIIAIGESSAFKIIESIASSLNIPYIEVKWNILSEEYSVLSNIIQNNEKFVTKSNKINIHPPAFKLIKAYIDIIDFYKWEYVTILFQESTGLNRLDDLLKIPKNLSTLNEFSNQNILNNKFRVIVKQLSSDQSLWFNLINEIKLSGSSHVIVDISTKYLNKFLEIADDAGLMTTYFHFLFTSLDLAALEYTPSANVTGFQIFEPNDFNVKNIFAEFNLKNLVSQKPMYKYMPSSAIFIHDAIWLVAQTIDEKNLVDFLPESPVMSCDSEKQWTYGEQMIENFKSMKINGLSGNIEFDKLTGYRKNLTLSIVDRTKNGVELIGYWKDTSPKPISVEAPYVMLKSSINNETLEGNDKYKGYCVDLLVKISKICGFNYTIKPVADGVHGTLVNGKWNGIINELIDKKADIAVAGLTITYQREQAIDFTKPFLNLGISILYKRQQKINPNIFSFLSPLSIDIWLYIIAAYLFVSILLFVLSRFSPYEWKNPYPCKKESDVVENQFTLTNSLWFTIGSLMKQGSDINPKSFSARILTGVWWFFALIMISSYTANLAAFLTTKRLSSPIEDVEGLSKQSEIKYGCLIDGSTQQFFRESKIHTYERMWNFMNSQPNVFVSSTEEGIERVKKGGFAYLLESTTNDYLRQRDCELMQVGGLIDTKGYGIGTPPGSPWRDQISNAILQLQEKGDLQELYTKWWEKESKDPNDKCEKIDDKKKDSANELSMANVGGVFVVLFVGLILSIIVAILEFYFKTRNHLRHHSLPEKIISRLKVACCHHKHIRRSSSLKNLDLNSEIRLVAPSENDDYSRKIMNMRKKRAENLLNKNSLLIGKLSNSMDFDQPKIFEKNFPNKSKSLFFQDFNSNLASNKKYHYSFVNKPAYRLENHYLKRKLSPVHLNEINTEVLKFGDRNFSAF